VVKSNQINGSQLFGCTTAKALAESFIVFVGSIKRCGKKSTNMGTFK